VEFGVSINPRSGDNAPHVADGSTGRDGLKNEHILYVMVPGWANSRLGGCGRRPLGGEMCWPGLIGIRQEHTLIDNMS
jgi:hypothetical protein